MKQKDIIVIIVVAIVSATLAAVSSKFLIRPAEKQQQAEVVLPITADFPAPDRRFFNPQSIDPTLPIQIGNNTNPDPFRGTTGQ